MCVGARQPPSPGDCVLRLGAVESVLEMAAPTRSWIPACTGPNGPQQCGWKREREADQGDRRGDRHRGAHLAEEKKLPLKGSAEGEQRLPLVGEAPRGDGRKRPGLHTLRC